MDWIALALSVAALAAAVAQFLWSRAQWAKLESEEPLIDIPLDEEPH